MSRSLVCRWCGETLAGVKLLHRGDATDGIDVYNRLCSERDGDFCDRRRRRKVDGGKP